jgi:predicted NAD/FAD-binding protein
MRAPGGVVVRDANGGLARFDHVVLATHADTSLRILGRDADPAEREVLSAFSYQENLAVLHRDASLMPTRRAVWSSWNYLSEERVSDGRERVSVSYWMNRLQNLRTEQPVILTLNPPREPREVEHTETYHHPQFDTASLTAQSALPSLQGIRNTWFCGSYFGMGFHEDALRSGLEVAAALRSPAPWWDAPAPSVAPSVPAGVAR